MNSTCPAIDYQTNKDRTLEKNLKGEGGPYLQNQFSRLMKIRLKKANCDNQTNSQKQLNFDLGGGIIIS